MEISLDLRTATAVDVPELLALVQSAYRGETSRQGWNHEADLLDGQRTTAEALAAVVASDDDRILLAFDGARMIGCVQITRSGPDLAYLGMLTVDPQRQTGGLGRALLNAAERAAAELFGSTRIEMTVIRQRTTLIAYYQRRGYHLTGESRPFPYDDERFGVPKFPDLAFTVLEKRLA